MPLRPTTTLAEILAIPGNRPVYDALAERLRQGKALAFVGAGASAGMYPLWEGLIDRLIAHAAAEGKAEAKDAARWKADQTSSPQQRVNLVLRRLGEPLYRSFLKETFGPRKGVDGRRYTGAHAALLRLTFRGYVTTNYDPGLDFARAELRPDSLSTGTPTWQDDDEVYRWRTGDVFADDCPMLWLHGYWQRPAGIVLNSGEYSQAYKQGIYRDTFNELWVREQLVFLGFGFADRHFSFMVGEFLRDLGDASSVPRHIAILGWPMQADGGHPDPEEIAERREAFESDYHVRLLFYPVHGSDHAALQVLLDGLVETPGCATHLSQGAPSPVRSGDQSSSPSFSSKWVHETTDDEKFIGRDDEIARLDRWVRDESVRTIGVCAVGGTGKTALLGHWLKKTSGWRSRPFIGLFAWSFYQDRSTASFLREFLGWAQEALGTPKRCEVTPLVASALSVLRAYPLVIVLDGLEVLQEGQDDARHGTFLDGGLRELLTAICQREHRSLALLTSRFVFTDLERLLGTSLHQLELRGLSPDRGAALLEELGVGGFPADRENVSERLDGHPLALRIFSEALPACDRGEPRRFLDQAFKIDEIPSGAPLSDKLRRLLVFYERQLTSAQMRLLGIVALFRSPVADATVLRLSRALSGGEREGTLPGDAELASELRRLHLRKVLSREPMEGGYGSACHPILRDHFRAVLLGAGATLARRAADLLTGQPSAGRPESVKEIEPVLLAIDLLLEAGEFGAADDLYRDRLNNGTLLRNLPANAEGLACSVAFVSDEVRRRSCEERLSARLLSFHLNEVGLFAGCGGYLELALHYFELSASIDREARDVRNVSTSLQNQVGILIGQGQLARAEAAASEAAHLAVEGRAELIFRSAKCYRGSAAGLLGQVRPAADDFAIANSLERKLDPDGDHLYSLRGIHWAELLLRSGIPVLAKRNTETNLRICLRHLWYEDVALCRWILAWCAVTEGRLEAAESLLREAGAAFHRGQCFLHLARVNVTAGEVALARRDAPGALHSIAEAIDLAAPRGMKLVHADALVLRGRVRRLQGHADRALDDAEEALQIARQCGYVWAERDSLRLSAEARALLASTLESAGKLPAGARELEASRRARAEAEALDSRLRLTDDDLAAAEAKAAAWLERWERNEKARKS